MPIFAICDDNQADMAEIMEIVREWSANRNRTDIRVQHFASPYDLLDTVSRGGNFDLFLLDILMPEMTGIALGEQLRQLLADPLLLFLTTSEDYYPDAFRLYAFQYLCKPLQKDDLFAVLDKAASRWVKRESDVFFLKTTEGLVRIPLHTIVYVELLSHVCHFYLADGQHLESQYLRTGFDSFVEQLLRNRQFVKTHASYVVSLDFISKFSGNTLLLTTDKVIPVARSLAKRVQQRYVTYGLREEGSS